jgi:hypothetical protein
MALSASWANIKTFVNTYSIPIQWIDLGSLYFLKAYQDKFEVECYLPKDGGADQTDFETNFKAAGNQPVRTNIVQVLGKDTLTLTPFGAFSGTTLQANALTNWDVKLPQTMTLKGAELFSLNSTLGDWLAVSVIDKDNVTGQGGTPDNPTIIATYVVSWYIAPGIWNKVEDVSISEPIPAGLYMRFAYTSVGSTAPTAVVNFFSYVGTP